MLRKISLYWSGRLSGYLDTQRTAKDFWNLVNRTQRCWCISNWSARFSWNIVTVKLKVLFQDLFHTFKSALIFSRQEGRVIWREATDLSSSRGIFPLHQPWDCCHKAGADYLSGIFSQSVTDPISELIGVECHTLRSVDEGAMGSGRPRLKHYRCCCLDNPSVLYFGSMMIRAGLFWTLQTVWNI